MKKQLLLLFAAVALLASCNNDNTVFEGEEVEVSFRAEIPVTRAAGDLTVNKVVCAVFEKDTEIAKLRKEISIEDGEDIVFAPRLIKGHTYDIVFWAMKDNCYNVKDLTEISRNDNATATEADYDAFTKSVEITVNNSVSLPVTLTRPLAQLNVAISEDDWNTAYDKFGITPTTTEIKVAKKTFCALCGAAEYTGAGTGETEYTTYTLTASGEEINVNGTKYKSIASCYIFAEDDDNGEKHIIDILSVKDKKGNVIRYDVTIPAVTLQNNYKTNIVGSILTGTVSYKISISEAFGGDNTTNYNK